MAEKGKKMVSGDLRSATGRAYNGKKTARQMRTIKERKNVLRSEVVHGEVITATVEKRSRGERPGRLGGTRVIESRVAGYLI